MPMIGIVDYGIGNVSAIDNMLRHVKIPHVLSNDMKTLTACSKLILPGVGNYETAWRTLNQQGWVSFLREQVENDCKPILGICVGSQLMTQQSEESSNAGGFGWVRAKTIAFKRDAFQTKLSLPHIGWNRVSSKRENAMSRAMGSLPRFYFMHSYHFEFEDPQDPQSSLSTNYGYPFCAAFIEKHVVGVQFHPEKSNTFGMTFFKAFWEGKLCS